MNTTNVSFPCNLPIDIVNLILTKTKELKDYDTYIEPKHLKLSRKDKDENTYVFAGDMKTNKKNFKDLKDTKKTNPFSKLLSLNIK